MASTDDRPSIFLDLDGFAFGPTDDIEPRHSTRHQEMEPSRIELSMVHYILRSTMTLGLERTEDDLAKFMKFSKACLLEAEKLVYNWEEVPNPAWLGDFRKKLKNSGKVDSSEVDSVGFSFILTPKIQAYCFPSERLIEISAVTMTHLRTVNLLLWTMAGEISRKAGPLDEALRAGKDEGSARAVLDEVSRTVGEDFLDCLLSYLFSLYFPNVNYSSLPIPRAPSGDIFMRAKTGSLVQVEFMLAHECAHLLLHQGRSPSADLEREADIFSYELLFNGKDFWKHHSGIFYTSCRWFFLYLALDRIIGAVLSGYEIDWIDLPIRDREMWLYERTASIEFKSEEERDCQFYGDVLLFYAKGKLRERGVDWIKSAAEEFQKKHCFLPPLHP